MPKASAKTLSNFRTPENWPEIILETIQDPVQVIDRNYRVRWSNGCLSEDLKTNPGDLLGRTCYEIFFQRRRPCPDCPLAQAFATGRSSVREKVFHLPEGTSIWKQVRVYPILDAEGRTELVVKIGLDVTSEKHRQRRLDRYLRQLETSIQEAEPEPSPSSSEGETERERFFGLTDRELEVLRLLARGFTNARIAGLLDISLNTVKTHVSHIFDKLDVGDRVRAAILAARLKLV